MANTIPDQQAGTTTKGRDGACPALAAHSNVHYSIAPVSTEPPATT